MNRVGAAVVGAAATAMVATACASTAGRSVTPPAVVSAATVYQATMSGGSAKFESTFSVTPANGKGRLIYGERGVLLVGAARSVPHRGRWIPAPMTSPPSRSSTGTRPTPRLSAKAARWLMI